MYEGGHFEAGLISVILPSDVCRISVDRAIIKYIKALSIWLAKYHIDQEFAFSPAGKTMHMVSIGDMLCTGQVIHNEQEANPHAKSPGP